MRAVLDIMADQCKRQRYADHVRAVFADAVSNLNWDQRVQFTRAAMKRLEPFLSPEIRNESPERFARQLEVIVRSYVESLDRFSQLLRTL